MDAQTFHERGYRESGLAAQRRYPNEELMRFMGRNFFGFAKPQRAAIRILEAGCGSGANLWAIAREGFDAHGIDISAEGIRLCADVLSEWGVRAKLQVGDMSRLPYPDKSFNAVLDVFSSYCLTESQFGSFLSNASRALRPGGVLFSYAPSKASDAFKDRGDSILLDASTLSGITRPTAPFSPSPHPFRFISPEEYEAALKAVGLTLRYCERVGRTYRDGAEYFEWLAIEAHR